MLRIFLKIVRLRNVSIWGINVSRGDQNGEYNYHNLSYSAFKKSLHRSLIYSINNKQLIQITNIVNEI